MELVLVLASRVEPVIQSEAKQCITGLHAPWLLQGWAGVLSQSNQNGSQDLRTSAGNAGTQMFTLLCRMWIWKDVVAAAWARGSGLKMNHPEGVELSWEEENVFRVGVEDLFPCLEWPPSFSLLSVQILPDLSSFPPFSPPLTSFLSLSLD